MQYLHKRGGLMPILGGPLTALLLLTTGCLTEPIITTCADAPNAAACRDEMPDPVDGSPLDPDTLQTDTALSPDAADADVPPVNDAEPQPAADARPMDAARPTPDEGPPVCVPTGEEVCDGMDNDCDDVIDEDVPPFTGRANMIERPGISFVAPSILQYDNRLVVAWIQDRRMAGQNIRVVFYDETDAVAAEIELANQRGLDEFNQIQDLALTRTDTGQITLFWIGREVNVAGGNTSYLKWAHFNADLTMSPIRQHRLPIPPFHLAARGLGDKVAVAINGGLYDQNEGFGVSMGFVRPNDAEITLSTLDAQTVWHQPALVRRGANGVIALWVATEGNFGPGVMYSELDDEEQVLSFANVPGTENAGDISAWEVSDGFALAWSKIDGVRNDLLYDIYLSPPGRAPQSVLDTGARSLVPRIPNTPAQGNYPIRPKLVGPSNDRSTRSLHLIWTHERLDTDEGALASLRYTQIRDRGRDGPAWLHDVPVDVSDGSTNAGFGAVASNGDAITVAWHALGATGPAVGGACSAVASCGNELPIEICHELLSILLPQAYQCMVAANDVPAGECDANTLEQCFEEWTDAAEPPTPAAAGLVIERGALGCGRMAQ